MRIVIFIISIFILNVELSFAERVRIGVSLPLSGDAAPYGTDFQNIYRFANQMLADNAYDLVFEDDQCDPRIAVSVANKLTAIDKIRFVLGATCDGVFSAVGPIYQRAGTVVISTSASVVQGKTLFHTVPAQQVWRETFLKSVKGHISKLAVISEETGFAQDFATGLRKLAPQASVTLLEESLRSSETDFRSVLSRLARQQPDAFLFLTQTDASLLRLVQQYYVLKLRQPIYSVFFAATATFLKGAGVKAEGIRVLDFLDVDNALTEPGSDVYKQYVRRVGSLGSGKSMFISVYEAFRAMHLAIQSRQDPANYLRNTKFLGISGPWQFDETGFWTGPSLIMKVINNGVPVSVTNG